MIGPEALATAMQALATAPGTTLWLVSREHPSAQLKAQHTGLPEECLQEKFRKEGDLLAFLGWGLAFFLGRAIALGGGATESPRSCEA